MQHHKPLSEIAYDNLTSLKEHHIVRSEFIERLIKLHRAEHAAYYGEMVWVLTVLQLWLSSKGKSL